jgi:hypothetical protein
MNEIADEISLFRDKLEDLLFFFDCDSNQYIIIINLIKNIINILILYKK